MSDSAREQLEEARRRVGRGELGSHSDAIRTLCDVVERLLPPEPEQEQQPEEYELLALALLNAHRTSQRIDPVALDFFRQDKKAGTYVCWLAVAREAVQRCLPEKYEIWRDAIDFLRQRAIRGDTK